MDSALIKEFASKLNGTVKIENGQISATLNIPLDSLLALVASLGEAKKNGTT